MQRETPLRRLAIPITLLLVLSAAPLGASGGDSVAHKLDPRLAGELSDGDAESLRLIVVGAPIDAPAETLADRAAWKAHWTDAAAPFATEVARLALRTGSRVTSFNPAVPVAFLDAPRAAAGAFAASDAVTLVGLDAIDAVQLLDAPAKAPEAAALDDEADLVAGVPMTQAPDLWAMGFRGEGVLIAGIDTGIDGTHPVFLDAKGNSRVVRWIDVTNTCPAAPCDQNGHGTHTAATFAGSKAFGGRDDGMAPRAAILGIKIFPGASGSTAWETTQAGLQAAFDAGADVTSNSWGGSCSDAGAVATKVLAENLVRAGMISVFAAGNSGSGARTINCPGDGDLLITVGATDRNYAIASFSSRGACQDGRICPDVVADGVNVNAALPGGGYGALSGTSMATPHVAGAVALLQQIAMERRGGALHAPTKEAEALLKATARDLGAAGPDNHYGWGFIKVRDAAAPLLASAPVSLSGSLAVEGNALRASTTTPAHALVQNAGAALPGSVALTLYPQSGASAGTPVASSGDITLGAGATAFDATVSGAGLDLGQYAVRARVTYTWTDASGATHTGAFSRWDTVVVRGVRMSPSLALPATINAGATERVLVSLSNAGNEAAKNVTATLRVPLAYVPDTSPAYVYFGLNSGDGLHGSYAWPGPSGAEIDVEGNALVLTWNVPPVEAGSAWRAEVALRAAVKGEQTLTLETSWKDQVGEPGSATRAAKQTIA